jgi:hypothetical protein
MEENRWQDSILGAAPWYGLTRCAHSGLKDTQTHIHKSSNTRHGFRHAKSQATPMATEYFAPIAEANRRVGFTHDALERLSSSPQSLSSGTQQQCGIEGTEIKVELQAPCVSIQNSRHQVHLQTRYRGGQRPPRPSLHVCCRVGGKSSMCAALTDAAAKIGDRVYFALRHRSRVRNLLREPTSNRLQRHVFHCSSPPSPPTARSCIFVPVPKIYI